MIDYFIKEVKKQYIMEIICRILSIAIGCGIELFFLFSLEKMCSAWFYVLLAAGNAQVVILHIFKIFTATINFMENIESLKAFQTTLEE